MTSLREMIETVFAAAAFAERNLPEEACAMIEGPARSRETARTVRRATKDARPRPTLRA